MWQKLKDGRGKRRMTLLMVNVFNPEWIDLYHVRDGDTARRSLATFGMEVGSYFKTIKLIINYKAGINYILWLLIL
jgi:hypothetical protein